MQVLCCLLNYNFCDINPSLGTYPSISSSRRPHSMTKKKSRLLTHHVERSQRSRNKFPTLSNSGSRVRKVFTESTSSSSLVGEQNQLEEVPMIVDDLDHTPVEIDYPANISVRTKAKRYQNSV